ncbi:MAG: hypothetical protein H6608_12390 [Flavobacteriales bacterium]|nr:hypothetical protein [Bacteroidota bacterium]MCB9241930.1 hypothetical protein [Flavobacteriales bacterium]
MKKSTVTFWLLNIIGALAIFASIFSYSNGQSFNSYFWGGFCGLVLIGTSSINRKQNHPS